MCKIVYSGKFKKELKACRKRNYNIKLLEDVLARLKEDKLTPKDYDHKWVGSFRGYQGARELHIRPDWLLVYVREEGVIKLLGTGTHSDMDI